MSPIKATRRKFLKQSTALTAATFAGAFSPGVLAGDKAGNKESLFKYSLAQWSLHRGFRSGKYKSVDFARIAKNQFGFTGIEYVNQLYFGLLNDKLIKELDTTAKGEGVESLLIMIDREGALGDPDSKARKQSVQNHYKWADAAHALGCHSIRVNAQSSGTYDDQMKAAADGLNQLAEYCEKLNLNVIVENHGGLSSNGKWLAGVMKLADNPRVGTLPDFGNFTIDRETGEKYDIYLGVQELMPYAKAVSAKAYNFNDEGVEPDIDFFRMMKIVKDAGYRGWVGIEYEGDRIGEEEGIVLTHKLLQRAEAKLLAEAWSPTPEHN